MKNFELLITWLTPHVSALYHFLGGITVSLVLGIPIVFLFGDTLLELLGHALTVVGHGLHFVFEIFESITGHILEEAFHLHKRTAEIIFFWSSLASPLVYRGISCARRIGPRYRQSPPFRSGGGHWRKRLKSPPGSGLPL